MGKIACDCYFLERMKISCRCFGKKLSIIDFWVILRFVIAMKLVWSITKAHYFVNDRYLEKQVEHELMLKTIWNNLEKKSEGCICKLSEPIIKCSRAFIFHGIMMDEKLTDYLERRCFAKIIHTLYYRRELEFSSEFFSKGFEIY